MVIMIIIGLQFLFFYTPKFQLLFAIENTNMCVFLYFNTIREKHTHTEMHVDMKICFWRELKRGLDASLGFVVVVVVVICVFSCDAQPRNPRTSQERARKRNKLIFKCKKNRLISRMRVFNFKSLFFVW